MGAGDDSADEVATEELMGSRAIAEGEGAGPVTDQKVGQLRISVPQEGRPEAQRPEGSRLCCVECEQMVGDVCVASGRDRAAEGMDLQARHQ